MRYYLKLVVLAGILLVIFSVKSLAEPTRFYFKGSPAELNIQFISENTVRISILPVRDDGTCIGTGESSVLSASVKFQPDYQSRIVSDSHPVRFENKGYRININGDILTFQLESSKGDIKKEIKLDAISGSVSFKLEGSPVFGLGQGAEQYERSGTLYPMVVGNKQWKMYDYGGTIPVPWLISPEGWGVFFHKPHGSIDLRNDEVKFLPDSYNNSPLLDFFVVLADSPVDLLGEFGKITGSPTLPPRWSLGYMQSHRTLKGPEEVLGIAETFRNKNLPCDALIYLGTGWCPAGWNLGHGSFTFNPGIFPDSLLKKLKHLNFNPVLHVVFPPEELYGMINSQNVSPKDSLHVVNYWARHKALKEKGVLGWWPDSGEKLSLNSRIARIRMYYDGDRQDYNSRTFALHRTGFAGMQKYGAWLWSGDVYSTWSKLQEQIPMGLNTSVSGIPYWGTDIGGFFTTPELTGELYTRWFQLGTFNPSFRSHGRNWYTRLPWGWNTGDPGPDEIGERPPGQGAPDSSEMHNPLVEPICRKYLKLRYQLLPYNYSLAYESSESGLPFMRPLWLHYSGNELYKIQDQFLWGRDILIAPVIQKGARARKVYLPEGEWYDFWTSEIIHGGKEMKREVDLETMPIYVRAGAIIPMGPEIQHTGESQFGPLTIRVYPGEDGEFLLYEDDGQSYDYLQGEYMKTKFHWDDASAMLSICPENGMNLCPGNQRKITIQLMSENTTKSLLYSGDPVEVTFDN